jgi:hypothetical protein
MKKSLKILALISVGVSLSGCDSVRNTLGLDHYQPDEFNVTDHPPLSMPKDYNLRPPVDGKPIPNRTEFNASTQQAEQTLLGPNRGTAVGAGSGQSTQSIVDQAKAGQTVDPNIRTTVDQEAKNEGEEGVIGRKMKEIRENAASIYKKDEPNVAN